ncbi:MAG: HDOD domain-containing protein [Pseudomonadota bacterium]
MKKHLNKWLEKLANSNFPVLPRTRAILASETVEDLSLEALTGHVALDLGLVINLLHYANTTPHQHFNHRLTTIEYTVRMLGINKIRQICLDSPVLTEVVPPQGQAVAQEIYGRASLAALLARAWAVRRKDMVPDEVYLAAMLYFCGELGMAVQAAARMQAVRQWAAALRVPYSEAQYVVFGFTQEALAHSLAKRWNMPQLAIDALEPGNASFARIYGLQLAVQAANQYQAREEALPVGAECFAQIIAFLNLDEETVLPYLRELHQGWQQRVAEYQLPAFTTPAVQGASHGDQEEKSLSCLCVAPQASLVTDLFQRRGYGYPIENHKDGSEILLPDLTFDAMIEEVVHAMHDGAGLNRVVYAKVIAEQDLLRARIIVGAEDDPLFDHFVLDLKEKNLFSQLLARPNCLWINRAKWESYGDGVPQLLDQLNPMRSFFVQTLHVKGRALGLFYADRRSEACQLDKTAFERFKQLGALAQRLAERALKK